MFRSVGQGLFYTGKIGEFTFVYDCGSTSTRDLCYLKNSIEDFQNEVNVTKLGLLVISHFDSDHINGLQHLSEKFKEIDTVVIPYIEPSARLLIYLNNPKQSLQYYQFLIDPITYLISHFTIRQVIILRGNRDDENSNFIRDDNPDDPTPSRELNRPPIKLVNQFGRKDYRIEAEVVAKEKLNIEAINSQIYFHRHEGFLHLEAMWKFSFFNYDREDSLLTLFKNILAVKNIDCSTKESLNSVVSDPLMLTELVECYRSFIKIAKTMANQNITGMNNTSLVLFHGPIGEKISRTSFFHEEKRKLFHVITRKSVQSTIDDVHSNGLTKQKVSKLKNKLRTMRLTIQYKSKRNFGFLNHRLQEWFWNSNKTILFGDINVTSDLKQIRDHFGEGLSQICTVLVPHHGSKGYWDQDFIMHFYKYPCLWVANYGATNSYGHPDLELIHQLKDFNPDMALALNNEIYQIRQIMTVTWSN